jgi:hypothetical protein
VITVNGYVFAAEDVLAMLEAMMRKQAEGRPLTPGLAAVMVTGWLECIGPGYHPGGIEA